MVLVSSWHTFFQRHHNLYLGTPESFKIELAAPTELVWRLGIIKGREGIDPWILCQARLPLGDFEVFGNRHLEYYGVSPDRDQFGRNGA